MKAAKIFSAGMAGLIVLGLAAFGTGPGRVSASSHREAPLISAGPRWQTLRILTHS